MFENAAREIRPLLTKNLSGIENDWFKKAVEDVGEKKTARALYLKYSLCGSSIGKRALVDYTGVSDGLGAYLMKKEATTVELSRIALLISALKNGKDEQVSAVKKLIEVADRGELETFLKYLAFLPMAEHYLFAAVEALRTNITTVFEAISKYNPYPYRYFSEQQWNQMYLKAAFLQLDLGSIVGIDERANASLAQIISDYAHERWAASRTIDPYFWRPVSQFLNEDLLRDIERLLQSEHKKEQMAGALVCLNSKQAGAKKLLERHPDVWEKVEKENITWNDL